MIYWQFDTDVDTDTDDDDDDDIDDDTDVVCKIFILVHRRRLELRNFGHTTRTTIKPRVKILILSFL